MKPGLLIKKSKRLKHQRHALPYASIQRVLLIWDGSQAKTDIEELKTFGHELRKSGKDITFLTFHNIKKFPPGMQGNDLYHLCCRGDFTLFANPKNKDLKHLLNQSFDLLINGCLEENIYLKTIAMHSKASFRIGPFNALEDTHFYELLIKPNGADLCENYLIETGRYLRKII